MKVTLRDWAREVDANSINSKEAGISGLFAVTAMFGRSVLKFRG